jgi:hypothetical protein
MTYPIPPISADSAFKERSRISRSRFGQVLREAGSPWAGQADVFYRLITGAGHDPAVWLAIAGREHRYGAERESVLWRSRTNSWTNARSVRLPNLAHEIVSDPIRGGPYVRYQSVEDSLRDGLYRIDDPGYVYQQRGALTIGQVLRLWTESDPAGYIDWVVRQVNQWIASDQPWWPVYNGLVDVRSQLATAGVPGHGPRERLPFGQKRGVVVHYSGPPVARREDTLAVLQAEARYHAGKNWGAPGEPPIRGDGLMYHLAVGDDGTVYLCRDLDAVLWHCGVGHWNRRALSLHVPIGGEQRATPAQLAALARVVDGWLRLTGTSRQQVWGHRELSPTSCPGTLMADFVYPYRVGGKPMADGHYFEQTGKHVGGAFWRFWRERGGLAIFGYPLTGERDELCEDGQVHTVQYFERAVFEWHPNNQPPHQVLLRRLGADALAESREKTAV